MRGKNYTRTIFFELTHTCRKHTVHGMTRAFNELTNEGYVIDPELFKLFAPYRTGHINRFGTHILNLDKIVEPLVEERDFKLKLNSIKSKQ